MHYYSINLHKHTFPFVVIIIFIIERIRIGTYIDIVGYHNTILKKCVK